MRRKYRFRVGDVVRSTSREMRNVHAVFPAGTLFTVSRRYGGYHLDAHPCTKCGIQLRITRIPDGALEAGQ